MAASDWQGVAMEEESLVSEAGISQMRGTQRSFRFSASAVVLLLGAALVATVATRSPVTRTDSPEFTSKEQIVVQSPLASCSKPWTGKPEDDCSETKCCQVSGHSCYEKEPGTYGCLETCDPAKKWTCQMPNFIVPLSEVKRHSSLDAKFYCFSVYTEMTGSTKISHELGLLQGQYQRKASLFGCDYSNVFSDVDVLVGPDYRTIKVEDVDNDWHKIKREETGTWINTGMFKQVWKAVAGKTQDAEWVIKVDADAIFVPHRLKGMLQGHPVTYTGIYIENCNTVQWGFFGNLEVFSIEAWNTLLANLDSCSQKIDWVKGTKWGPIGEDLFAQMCMDFNGVSKVQNFGLTTDAACPGTKKRWGAAENDKKWQPPCNLVGTPALHPFKKPEDYFSCLDATMTFG